MSDSCKYNLENLPISKKTRDGLTTENINMIGAIGRMLCLQDEVYDEQFSRVLDLLTKQAIDISDLKKDISELKTQIGELKDQVREITEVVDNTREDVALLKTQVELLKAQNTIWAYAGRIAIAVGIALGLARWFHGPFK